MSFFRLAALGAAAAVAAAFVSADAAAPPPLFGAGERVLFQGDSITDMNRGRTADPNHLLGHSYAFLVGAAQGEAYPEREIVFINRGVSGDTLPRLEARWQRDTLDLHPDVLSLLVGINDVGFSLHAGRPLPLAEMEAAYDRLLAAVQLQNPRLKVIVGEPFVFPGRSNTGQFPEWRRRVEATQAMAARVAERHHAALIHFQRMFEEAAQRAPLSYWIWDGIHPTYPGQQLMAKEWQRAFGAAFVPHSPEHSDNSAELAVPKLESDSYDWYQRHLAVLDVQEKLRPDVVLIGDSITHFWGGEPTLGPVNGAAAWAETFAGHRVLNLGFGWDRTQNVLWRIEHGELNGVTPRTIVLNIGTNNLTGTVHARATTPAETAAAIGLICRSLRAKVPGARLIVMAIFPRGRAADSPLRAPIADLNARLPGVLREISNTAFLDLGAHFLAADGSIPPTLMPDATHPSDSGYRIWGRALREAGALP